jgi:filamentous hemagglutinin family protein
VVTTAVDEFDGKENMMRMRLSRGPDYQEGGPKERTSLAIALIAVLWGCGLLASCPALAAPVIGNGGVTSGSATISQSGNVTNVNQSTNNASINWTSFSTKPAETVNFNQPGASAVTLNRVIGNEQSVLQGALNATGKVFLINSNGVLMTKGSSVNTAGFVASSLNMTDADFNAGNYVFQGNGAAGSVVNQGSISVKDGGYVALLGTTVSNQGTISATKGTVALSSGNKITLNFNGDSLVSVTIDQGTLDALVENKEAILADGGTVILTARAADGLLSAQVNNSGLIQARSIDDLKGSINLHAFGGSTTVAGTLDASAPTAGAGGLIETSGNKVSVADSAVITTKAAHGASGSWLIDPDGFTVSTEGDLSGAALTKALANGNVIIASTSGSGADGNINVDEAVSWAANTLTLNATNNIFVNNVMTATGTAGLAASYGSGTNADSTPMGLYTYQGATNTAFSGLINFSGTGGVTLNGTSYTVINTVAGMAAVQGNLAGNYVLGANISGLKDTGVTGRTWTGAIGDSAAFTGNFNGFGHLVVSPTLQATGLFGTIAKGATVSNLGITGANVVSSSAAVAAVGILADVNKGSMVNSFTLGSVNNTNIATAGGLVGDNSGLIAQCFSAPTTINVTGIGGGLVGTNEVSGLIVDSSVRNPTSSSGTVRSTATATGVSYVGGLVGVNAGKIERSYANVQLLLADKVSLAGSFAGKNTGIIDQSYAYSVNPPQDYSFGPNLAGFVWENDGTISNSYSASLLGTSPLSNWTAGFASINKGTISDSYDITYATGSALRSGFVQDNTGGTTTNDYWYSSPDPASPATATVTDNFATSLTSTQATTFTSYAGFDPAIWGTSSLTGHPILRNLLVHINTKATTIPTYGTATDYYSLKIVQEGLQWGDFNGTVPFTTTLDNGSIDAGTQAVGKVLTSTLYRNVTGTVSVAPKTLTVTLTPTGALVADKTYDGTTAGTLNSGTTTKVTGLVGTQTLALDSATFSDKNAGTGKAVTLGYTMNGTGKLSNYVIPTASTTTTASIAKKGVSATDLTGVNKVYDGTMDATVAYTINGAVATDDLTLNYSAAFADKNAGSGKTITVTPLTLKGSDASNYTLLDISTKTTSAAITPLTLTLYGSKADDGSTTIAGSYLTGSNIAAGDTVTLGGKATIASAATGIQALTDLTALTLNNPNYTLVGSVGKVLVGGSTLTLDQVARGTASIANSGTTTTITTSDKTVIDWLRFSVAADETLNFVQPSATSIVLNRVTGSETSIIAGILNSNGRVFIVNSSGILFAPGSSVNVAGLVASTLQLTDQNFANNNYLFTAGSTSGSVIAKGDIVIVDGGFLALAGNGVTNTGSVTVPGGDTLLVSAQQLTLTPNTSDAGLGSYAITGLKGTASVGGTLNLASASGKGGFLETAGDTIAIASDLALNTGSGGSWSWTQDGAITVGSTGTCSANFITTNLNLRNLLLNAVGGDITVSDAVAWSGDTTLTLNAANGIAVNNSLNTSGDHARLTLNANNGTIAINAPISSSGDHAGLTVNAKNGTIEVNAPVSASGADAKLVLNATKDIDFNADLSATGANAGLVMNYGGDYNVLTKADYSGTVLDAKGSPVADQAPAGTEYASVTLSGSNATLTMNGNSCTLIHTMADLAAIDDATGTAAGYYALGQDLDAKGTTYTGSPVALLSGTFAGLGHSVNNLTINAPDSRYTGLIGQASTGSTIRDIGIVNADIAAQSSQSNLAYVGALAGQSSGTVSHAYSTGEVSLSSSGYVGGLIGMTKDATVSDSYSEASVSGSSSALGGLIGSAIDSTVVRSHATGDLTSTGGGLIADATGTNIANCYATGDMTTAYASGGGLVGSFSSTSGNSIVNSFATGNLTGGGNLGGLVGFVGGASDVTIDNCDAAGNVTGHNLAPTKETTGEDGIGGFIGVVGLTGSTTMINVSHSHSSGTVTAELGSNVTSAGGFIGAIGGNSNGGNGSLISNSSASGDVNAPGAIRTGGLVGWVMKNGVTIASSSTTGNVVGSEDVDTYTGGLVGSMWDGLIADSEATGTVKGYETGGIAGSGGKNLTVTDSTWNTISNSKAVGDPVAAAQIAKARADYQLSAVNEAGRTVGEVLQKEEPTLSAADTLEQQPSIDNHIVFSDSDSYSADIKAISVDGVEFNLEEKSRDEKK